MIRAKVKVSQRIHKYIEVEADSYEDLYNEARAQFGSCITDDCDDFDDIDCDVVEFLGESDGE